MNINSPSGKNICPAFNHKCLKSKRCMVSNSTKVRNILEGKFDLKKIYSEMLKIRTEIHDNIFTSDFKNDKTYSRMKLMFDHFIITPVGSMTLVGPHRCNDTIKNRIEFQRWYIKTMSNLNKVLKSSAKLNTQQKIALFNEFESLFEKQVFNIPMLEIKLMFDKYLKSGTN